jgi:dihydrolipoamide dehydrogenase
MLVDLKIETLPNNLSEAKIVKIYKESGSAVTAQEVLFDIEGGKSSVSVKANAKGIIQKINVEVGDPVKVGDILAVIDGEEAHPTQFVPTAGLDYFGSLIKPKNETINCEIAIIGGGPGGYVAAIQAAKMGASVVLVERDFIGGTCLNRGCIPTKAFVRSAEVFRNLKNAAEFGCGAEQVSVDFKKVVSRKNDVVKKLVDGIRFLLDKHKIRVVSGTGELRDSETVIVKTGNGEVTLQAKNIILATGSKSAALNIPGIENKNVLSSNQVLEMESLPESMVIIGGGVIGMEFAFIFSAFGVEVSVVEYLNECLISCDPDVSGLISHIAMGKGIKLYKSSKVEEILSSEDGNCIVVFSENDGSRKYLPARKVLMSVGRVPCLDGLNIESAGIAINEKNRGIRVNEKMQTNVSNIYAIGDVTNKIMLAHVASQQGIVAVNNIMGNESSMDYTAVPNAIFTDPEIAMVGMCEIAAKEAGIEVDIGKFPFSANGKALAAGDERGFVKIVMNRSTKEIIGGAIIGLHATDLIAEITLAVANHMKADQVIKTIYAHPTTSEAVLEAVMALEGGSIHFAS